MTIHVKYLLPDVLQVTYKLTVTIQQDSFDSIPEFIADLSIHY